VLGTVRSALGLPFDLSQLRLPESAAGLRLDLENLIRLVEFSSRGERLVAEINNPAEAGVLLLEVPVFSVRVERPVIEWTFTLGAGRRLRLERLDTGEGVIAPDDLAVPQGEMLRLSATPDGSLFAFVGGTDVSAHFRNLTGGKPILPEVPRQPSQWLFSAEGALFDSSTFDFPDTFDRPLFRIELAWRSYEPLTFDVYVPYFFKSAVGALAQKHGYDDEIFVYEGLDLQTVQGVVDKTRAAGVRGSVHFSLNFIDDHNPGEAFSMAGDHRLREEAEERESFTKYTGAQISESHAIGDRLSIGGAYDIARFDGVFGFDREGG
jgi:hypothetical protein